VCGQLVQASTGTHLWAESYERDHELNALHGPVVAFADSQYFTSVESRCDITSTQTSRELTRIL